MPSERELDVHFAPEFVGPERLVGSVTVVVDVLRATTSIVHALAAACVSVRPCRTAEEARRLAPPVAGIVLYAGERDGLPLPSFDLGNSPGQFTPDRCRGNTLIMSTTNGTRALLHAAAADRLLVAAFVNLSAVCERLRRGRCPIHVLCAGDKGAPALEDALLAGAIVDHIAHEGTVLNDTARLAWATWRQHRHDVLAAVEAGTGAAGLRALGYDEDIRAAARVDVFDIVPELFLDPPRIELPDMR
jgi:2-phosphosulfolactate phosphatase